MCKVTKHARKRLVERLHCSNKAAVRTAHDAYKKGIPRQFIPRSRIRDYMDKRSIGRGKYSADLRLFNGYIFVFRGNTLVTILNIPDKYK